MNLLIIISDLGLGGAQKVAISLANGLSQRHNVHLYDISPEVRRPEFFAEISPEVHVIKHTSTIWEKVILKILYALLNLLPDSKKYERKLTYLEKRWFIKRFTAESKIELINSHLWWADKFVEEIFGNNIPCPFVISAHGDHIYFSVDDRIPRFASQLKRVFSKATALLYLSDNYLELVANLKISNPPKMIKVTHGFKFTKPTHPPLLRTGKKKFTFLLASRAIEDKGWKEAIECIIRLHQDGYIDCNLLIAGDGQLLGSFKALYPPYKYPYITFLGFQSDVLSYAQVSDVMLLPTYHPEQLPTFIIEGLFLGKPIVATDVGEIRNMITYDSDLAGMIIPLVNGKPDTEKLYAAMLELMTNEELRNQYSHTALKAYEKFDYETFIKQYEKIFLDILGDNSNAKK